MPFQDFLKVNLPKVKDDKKGKFKLGVSEAKLGSAIQVRKFETQSAVNAHDLGIDCSWQMRTLWYHR